MRYELDISRSLFPGQPEWRQVFAYETDDPKATVAVALREINAQPVILDANGEEAQPIAWECSCLQKKCGACAMVINGTPALACDTFLHQMKTSRVTLDPLRKFPRIVDLVVERDVMFNRLLDLQIWLEKEVELPAKRSGVAYEASRCLQCGCCLEVCPNFAAEGAFGGMATMTPMARLLAEASPDDRKRLAAAYKKAVLGGCGKSLACVDICPAGIDISQLMSRSNAAAVWGRW